MKKKWEEKLDEYNKIAQNKSTQNGHIDNESAQVLESKMKAMEMEKDDLITRNSLLVEKISKIS